MKSILSSLVPISIALICLSCTANMELRKAVTKKGIINTNGVSLGQLLKWDADQKTLTRVNTLQAPQSNLIADASGRDELVKFENSAKFTGGVALSPQEIINLEAEVSSKSSLQAKDLKKHAYRKIVEAITSEMNADPSFISTMAVQDAIHSNGRKLYVLIDEITIGKSLEIKVQGVSSTSASGSSQKFKATSANVDFCIADTESLNITGSNGSDVSLFYRFSVFRPTLQDGNYNFATVSDKKTLTEIREALQVSEY